MPARDTAAWAAPEPHTARTMHAVVAHTKERMAELAAIETVVPRGWTRGELRRPAGAREVQRPLMVEMQALEPVLGLCRVLVDGERVWAWPTAQQTDTAQGGRLEHAHERLLVVRIRMAQKLGPQRVAQPRTHALGEARRGRTHEGAPALLGAADPKHSRA